MTPEQQAIRQRIAAIAVERDQLRTELATAKAELAERQVARALILGLRCKEWREWEGCRDLLTTLMHRAYMRLDYREADEIANFLGVPSPIVHEMQDL